MNGTRLRALGFFCSLATLALSLSAPQASAQNSRVERVRPSMPANVPGPGLGYYDTPQAGYAAWKAYIESDGCNTNTYVCNASDFRPCTTEEGQYGYSYGQPHDWCARLVGTRKSDGNVTHDQIAQRLHLAFDRFCPDDGPPWAIKGKQGSLDRWCERTIPQDRQVPPDSCTVGNPVSPGDGIKRQTEMVYADPLGRLNFSLFYRSDRSELKHNFQDSFVPPGDRPSAGCHSSSYREKNWDPSAPKKAFCFPYLSPSSEGDQLSLISHQGYVENFSWANNVATPLRASTLNQVTSQQINGQQMWVVKKPGNEVRYFDGDGRLVRVQSASSAIQTLAYSDATTPPTIAPGPNYLISVSDAFGRRLQLQYDAVGRLQTLTDPTGHQTTLDYERVAGPECVAASCFRIKSVRFPDDTARTYHWNETANINGGAACPAQRAVTNLLTGITDENGNRFANYQYDCKNRALLTERAEAANRHSFNYVTASNGNPVSTTVTDPLNTPRTIGFTIVQGRTLVTSQSQPGGSGCGPASASTTYDANGNVATRTDFNGRVTSYTYDLSRNLETSHTEAVGTPEQRKVTTDWHDYWRLPKKMAEPKKITTYVYNDSGASCAPADALVGGLPIGVLCEKIEQATTDATGAQGLSPALTGSPRKWKYTYNRHGQVLTVNGPRTDGTSDTTTYTYDDATGNLISVTNALDQTTTLSDYDAAGRVRRITDPNGLVTVIEYYPRGWLKTRTVGNKVTRYEYDGVGQLKKLTLSDGSFLTYTYDSAHRLTDITDAAGNNIHYTLDAMGNRERDEIRDASGNLAKILAREYDALNRLKKLTGVQ
jgi:YD repeat-containing protein